MNGPRVKSRMSCLFEKYRTILQNERIKNMWLQIASKIRKIDRYDFIVFLGVVSYGVVFSFFTLLKHNSFQSYAWDLGIFDQALYSTLHGRFFYYTAELFMIPSGNYFASHVSPILLLILPFYAIYPSAETLLVLQAFVLALGAIPLYLAASNGLENKKAGVFFAMLYLLYAPVQASNWFDFHTQIFLPLFIFSAYYFTQKKRWKLYFLSIVLALMVEDKGVSILVFLISVYFLIVGDRKSIIASLKNRQASQSLVSLITMVLSAAWFSVSLFIKGSFYINPQFVVRYNATTNFSVLGIGTNQLLLPVYVFLNPQRAWAALMYDFPTKLFYLIVLFGPLIFVAFKSKFSLIPLFLLAASLLSNYLPYYTIGAQYPLYLVPLVFIASLIAIKKVHPSARLPILKIALVVSLIFIVSLSPLSPISDTFAAKQLVWYPTVSFFSYHEDVDSLHKLLDLIPPDAAVLTQNHIFPHVSNRLNAYVVPIADRFPNDTEYIGGLINKSEYILLDLWDWDPFSAMIFNMIVNNGSFGIYALGSKSLLFKKDYQGSPMFEHYTEYRFFQAYKDLWVSGQIVPDASSKSGNVALCPEGFKGLSISGPQTYLLPGTYDVTFMVKVDDNLSGTVGTLDISYEKGQFVAASRDLNGSEFRPGEWTNFTLTTTFAEIAPQIEFRVWAGGVTNLYLDGVVVNRVSTNSSK
jgi:uncharacterized membrane protein